MAIDKTNDQQMNLLEKIENVEIEDQMKTAYLDYAMSVIVGRALPDVRDGLKPVHRRILHAMNVRAWRSDKPFVKSAKIVGEVIGNYHPHGDTAVYDAMVRLAQDFSMRVPLIWGQGNFGSVDGDPAAAYRYTEARLQKVAEELLRDIDKETVDMIPNFDETRKEPAVLPAAFPNLLVNGSSGIAVGMATNIPPHNLGEVIDGTIALADNPELTVKELMKYIKGPDFPTGALIIGTDGIKKAYTSGKGSIVVRCKLDIETKKNGRESIIVTEIPYQVNKANLITRIATLASNKIIEGIAELRDESDRKGMRIVIGLKKDVNTNVVINLLYKHTPLQSSFGMNSLALVNNEPKILNLKEILSCYLLHRKEVITRRTQYELRKAEERAHILEGLKIALDNIDEVIQIIKSSKDVETASKKLQKTFKLSAIQAKAILDMRLQKLTSLEVKKIVDELKALHKLIAELKEILASEKKIMNIVKKELLEIRDKYNTPRKTEICLGAASEMTDMSVEDLIADEDMVINISNDGFIRRLPIDTFKKQKRGGKGVSGIDSKKNDFIKNIVIASMHDVIYFFSNKGKVFAVKTYELPVGSKTNRGKSLKAIINLATGESITAIAAVNKDIEDPTVCMITKSGIMKKISVDEFRNAKKGGIIAISLKKDDELVNVVVSEKGKDVVIASKQGLLLRTNIDKMRVMGRQAAGIIAMRLAAEDQIVGMDIIEKESDLFVVTEKGFGKRVGYDNFTVKGRGGKGMAYFKVTDKNGEAVGIKSVFKEDEIIITAKSGMTIRLRSEDISKQGRATNGIRILNIDDDDQVVDFAIVKD